MAEIIYTKKKLEEAFINLGAIDLQSFLNFALLHIEKYRLGGDTVRVTSQMDWFKIKFCNLGEPFYIKKDTLKLYQDFDYYNEIPSSYLVKMMELIEIYRITDRPAFSRLTNTKIFNILCPEINKILIGINGIDISHKSGSFIVSLAHHTLPRPTVTYDNGIFYHYIERKEARAIEKIIIDMLKEYYGWR